MTPAGRSPRPRYLCAALALREAHLALSLAATVLVSGAIVPAHAADAEGPDPHTVQPERPTVATHAHTVAPGWLEIESGIERDRFAGGGKIESATATAKLGVTRRTQLALTVNGSRDPANVEATSGLGDASLAFKLRLVDDAPLVGAFALLGAVKAPTGSIHRGTGTGTTDGSLLLISSHVFGPVSMDVNLGGTARSGHGDLAPVRAGLWTVAFGLPLRGTLGWAAELYGTPGTAGDAGSAPVIAVLFGPTWTPLPSFELDAGAIVPARGPQPHSLYAGCVWNVGRAWR